jgi:ankyrin repeat protein
MAGSAETFALQRTCISRVGRPAGQQTLDVQACLAAGADPDARMAGVSALDILATNGGEPEAAHLLLSAGAGNARAQVLHTCVSGSSMEIARVVLDYARDNGLNGWVDVHDSDLCTPLVRASRNARPGFVQLLLEYGADVTAVDDHGNTALHGVKHHADARLLLQRGAHVNARDRLRFTPLHLASTVELVDVLVDAGADLDATDTCGRTPVMFATILRRPRVAMRLLQRGADVATRDQNGHALLDHAINTGNAGLMREVLSRGACAAENIDVVWAVEDVNPDRSFYCESGHEEECTPLACMARMYDPAATVRTDADVATYLVALQREVRDLRRVTPDLQEAACQLAARWRDLHGTR